MLGNRPGKRASERCGWVLLVGLLLGLGLWTAPLEAWATDTRDPAAQKTASQSRLRKKKTTTPKASSQPVTWQKPATAKVTPKAGSASSARAGVSAKTGSNSGATSTKATVQRNSNIRQPAHRRSAARATSPEPYRSAVVMDAQSGQIVYAHDPHRKLVPASLTKMMLVLVVMEKVRAGTLRLSDPVLATESTCGVGGTQIDLKPGEALPLEEMLQAILIRSANDAAATVAEHIAGSQARCVELMNARARSLGMADTVFVNVHGLPSSNGHDNVSTAHDMAILAKALLRYPEILHWSSQEVAFIRGGRYPIHSTNKLLGRCEGVDGLKTGFVRKAGFNIAATAIREDRRLIAVVMGSPSSQTRNNATANLLAQGFERSQAGATTLKKGSSKADGNGHISKTHPHRQRPSGNANRG